MEKVGINPNFENKKKTRFQPATWEVIELLARHWYVTEGDDSIQISKSYYDVVFLKPTSSIIEKFNIKREVIVVFSNYPIFEPRSFDAIDKVRAIYQRLRFEEVCSIMISNDNDIESRVQDFLKSKHESQIIVPFSYKEIRKKGEQPYFIENRFRKYFYARDLFAYRSALQKDLYFFGRKDIIHTIVNRHLSGENTGVFGLRKTGKTSILYGVQRTLDLKNKTSLFIDCQDTSISEKRWFEVLFWIIRELYGKYSIEFDREVEDYNKAFASERFSQDISNFSERMNSSVLLLFDEVEKITPGISDNYEWRDGKDFVFFWRTIRANLQKNPGTFSYVLASTNPRAVEESYFNDIENPIFAQTDNYYISQFEISDTKDMVTKLGGYMGLKFDEEIFTYLTRDYGGHPFLIRHVCSTINEIAPRERPVKIDRLFYEKAKNKFETEIDRGHSYSKMILEVLEKYYPDEYVMLESLSLGDDDFFYMYAEESARYTEHLLGYGILQKNHDNFDFRIDTLKNYILNQNKYKKLKLSNEEKQKEISERRNRLEANLRKMVSKQLKYQLSEDVAKKEVLKLYDPKKQRQLSKLSYVDLFDARQGELYFDQLRQLMRKYWGECFRNIFESDVQKFDSRMQIINELRVGDAHAGEISDEEMQSFRGAMTWMEKKVKEYLQ